MPRRGLLKAETSEVYRVARLIRAGIHNYSLANGRNRVTTKDVCEGRENTRVRSVEGKRVRGGEVSPFEDYLSVAHYKVN